MLKVILILRIHALYNITISSLITGLYVHVHVRYTSLDVLLLKYHSHVYDRTIGTRYM